MATDLLHCTHCDTMKPPAEMRKDSSSKTGYRSQCRACKQKADAERKATAPKKAMSVVEKKQQARKEAHARRKAKEQSTEPTLFTCTRCEEEKTFDEMCKDRRKAGGVGSQCLKCRRLREQELKAEAEAKEEKSRVAASADLTAEWAYCWKCNGQHRPNALKQPPTSLPGLYPEGARLCSKCITKASTREDAVRAERSRRGLPANPTRKDLESAARVAALKQLIEEHESEYRNYMARQMEQLGVEQEKKWISL